VLVLRGDPDRQQVVALVVRGDCATRLERRGDQAGHAQPLPDDCVRLGEGALDVTGHMTPAHEHVVRRLVVERNLVVGRLDHRRELLDVEPDQLGRVGRGVARLGDDDGDRLAHVADAVDSEYGMVRLDDLDLLAARDDRERAHAAGDVVSGQHGAHTVCSQSRLDLHSPQPRVRVRAADEGCVQRIRHAQVVDVARSAGREPDVFETGQRTADPAAVGSLDGAHIRSQRTS